MLGVVIPWSWNHHHGATGHVTVDDRRHSWSEGQEPSHDMNTVRCSRVGASPEQIGRLAGGRRGGLALAAEHIVAQRSG